MIGYGIVIVRCLLCVVYAKIMILVCFGWFFFFQAEDGIRDLVRSRGLGDVYKRQVLYPRQFVDGGRPHTCAETWGDVRCVRSIRRHSAGGTRDPGRISPGDSVFVPPGSVSE